VLSLSDKKLSVPEHVSMDEMRFGGLVTLLRVDINSPIDPLTGKIIDHTRIKSHIPTIKNLITKEQRLFSLRIRVKRVRKTSFH